MNDLAFADSARPARDYTIGHELLLWRDRNPLILLSREAFNELPEEEKILSLVRAASICSRNWAENQKPEHWKRLWRWFKRRDIGKDTESFHSYLENGRKLMRVLSARNQDDAAVYEIASQGEKLEAGGRYLGSPFLSQLLLFVVSDLHAPLPAAYDMTFALAGNLYFTKLENEGRLSLENASEAETRKELEQQRADVAKEEEEIAKNQPGPEEKAQPVPVTVITPLI